MGHSQYAMEKYMRDENTPWLAIGFPKLKEKETIQKKWRRRNSSDGPGTSRTS
jgi:hypothetical protein